MFIIKPENQADWVHALFILSYYKVSVDLFSDGEDADSTYAVVLPKVVPGIEHVSETTIYEDDDRLAEMAFEMNWHQKGNLCPACEAKMDTDVATYHDRNNHCCGHLTFVKPINPAF